MTLPRRRFPHLATGAAAVATMPGGGAAFAQPAAAPRAKGPLVWLDMDPKELDDAYTQYSVRAEPPDDCQAVHAQWRTGT